MTDAARTKRLSKWLVGEADPGGETDIQNVAEVRARTATQAAEEYVLNVGTTEVVVVYPLRTEGEVAYFEQAMMPVMVPCEQPPTEAVPEVTPGVE